MRHSLEGQIAEVRHSLEGQIVEVRHSLEGQISDVKTQLAQLETRMTRLILGVGTGTVAVLGVLIGVLQAVD